MEKAGIFTGNGHVRDIVRLALSEDIGTGDVTTAFVVPAGMRACGRIVAKQAGVIAGLPVVRMVFDELDPDIKFLALAHDGQEVLPGQVVANLEGPAAPLLTGERVALNFLMHMSGIATAARAFAARLDGTRARLLDTRKTTPGNRVLEKYAVQAGGALNHRMNLAGGVLIKNNHIAVCGGVRAAVRAAMAKSPVTLKIEIEVRSVEEAVDAAQAGADMLLLDHMTPAMATEVRKRVGEAVLLEVSGNMTPDKAASFAESGVDFVSAGVVTYGAGWLDFSMYLDLDGGACDAG